MAYTRTDWMDGQTVVSEANLDKMEQGIYDAHVLAEAQIADAEKGQPLGRRDARGGRQGARPRSFPRRSPASPGRARTRRSPRYQPGDIVSYNGRYWLAAQNVVGDDSFLMPLPFVDLGHAGSPIYDPMHRWPLDEAAGNYRDLGGRGGKAPGIVAGTLARNPVAPPGIWLPGSAGFTGAGYINIWSRHLVKALTNYGHHVHGLGAAGRGHLAANAIQGACAGAWTWTLMVGHHSSIPCSPRNASRSPTST